MQPNELRASAAELDSTMRRVYSARSPMRAATRLLHAAANALDQNGISSPDRLKLIIDCEAILQELRDSGDPSRVEVLLGRITTDLLDAGALKASELLDDQSHKSSSPVSLIETSEAYLVDAKSDRRMMRLLLLTSLAAMLGAVAISLVGLGRASATQQHLGIAELYLVPAAIVLLSGISILWLADRFRRSFLENRRLARHFKALGPFLGDLPVELQDSLRGVMLPRLFPRILEDLDPLRDPIFPSWDELSAVASKPANDDIVYPEAEVSLAEESAAETDSTDPPSGT